MRILVTGAAGFIGGHTFELLESEGHDAVVYDKKNGLDILKIKQLNLVMKDFKPDAILHLAANSSLRKAIELPGYDARNNILGTLSVLQAMKDHGCNQIVFASTSAVYDPWIRIPYQEDDLTNPATPYGVSKLACENYIKIAAVNSIILRYGNVYGPGQKPLGENILIARTIAHMIDGESFKINGDGHQMRDWIYVEDVARANLEALKRVSAIGGTYNISTATGHSVNDVVGFLKYIIGFEGEIERGPGIHGEIPNVIMDNREASRHLNWEREISLTEGLERTVEAWPK